MLNERSQWSPFNLTQLVYEWETLSLSLSLPCHLSSTNNTFSIQPLSASLFPLCCVFCLSHSTEDRPSLIKPAQSVVKENESPKLTHTYHTILYTRTVIIYTCVYNVYTEC